MVEQTLLAFFPPVKMCPSFPGCSVSEDGRVFSHIRQGRIAKGATRIIESHPVKEMSVTMHEGYASVSLQRRKTGVRRVGVHVLLLDAFVGKRPEGMVHGRHLDDVRVNNSLTNLAWGTPYDNVTDAMRNGKNAKGETHGCHKLTENEVRVIRKRHAGGESLNSLASAFGVVKGTITFVVHRRTWKHVA